jgi:hypothetical protein
LVYSVSKGLTYWVKKVRIFKDINVIGGTHLMIVHNCSPLSLLTTVYPDYEWLPWKLAVLPKNFWSKDKNKRHFIEWAGKQLGVKELSDWHNVTSKDMMNLDCKAIPLHTLLSSVYPDFQWQFGYKSKSPFYKKTQHLLKSMLKTLFPQEG